MTPSPFHAFFGDVNRIQDEFARLFGPATATDPALNLWTSDTAYHAEMDVPGIDPATLEITLNEGNELTIKGERLLAQPEGATWLRRERVPGTFSRTVTLPGLVNVDAIEAHVEHGVLNVTLPKSEAAKPRRIAVK
jgi:HSP20 family protein